MRPPLAAEEAGTAAQTEFLEDVPEVESLEDVFLGVALLKSVCPEHVVLLSFFRIAQYGVSLADLLEFVFGLFVALVLVRVVFQGELPVGFFDFLGGRGFGHAEPFVVVRFRHECDPS